MEHPGQRQHHAQGAESFNRSTGLRLPTDELFLAPEKRTVYIVISFLLIIKHKSTVHCLLCFSTSDDPYQL